MNVPKSIFRQYDVRGIVGPGAHAGVRPRARPRLRHAWRGTGSAARRCIAVGPGQPALRARAGRRGAARHRRRRRHRGGRRRRCPPRRSTSPCPRSAPTPGSRSPARHNPPEFNGFKMVLGRRGLPRRGDPRAVGDHHGRAVALAARARRPPTARCSSAIARRSSAGTRSSGR